MWLTRLDAAARLAAGARWDAADAARRLAREPGLAWLDGGLEHGREGRYSFLAASPVEVRACAPDDPDPLGLLRTLDGFAGDERDGSDDPDADCALRGEDVPRWVGHVTYDAGRTTHAARHPRDTQVPALRFARYDAWVAFDHEAGSVHLVGDDRAACERLRAKLTAPPLDDAALAFEAGPLDATPHALHEAAVAEALGLIHAGEVYEINLARRLRASFRGSALGLFLRMRTESPVPLGYFVDGHTHSVLGRSMERFLRYRSRDRRVWTSPIKGTVARTGSDARSAAHEAHLLSTDPKEHAEHAMVVDLMRNDLSRVCEVGSVTVSALMDVLPFAGLSHLISTVEGRVRAGADVATVIAETFPPGSVTGAPKHRVIDAIEALEAVPRGLYTGCVGFLDRAGGCSLAVAIRTAVIAQGRVDYFAGGGIVADSVPTRESAETDLKARVFLRALGR
ncbi:MAG: anthranilate synthase component I family protein [Polyangiales bacterium]